MQHGSQAFGGATRLPFRDRDTTVPIISRYRLGEPPDMEPGTVMGLRVSKAKTKGEL